MYRHASHYVANFALLLEIDSPEDQFTNFDPERSNHRHDQHHEPVLTAKRGSLEDVLHPRDQGCKEDESDRRHCPENQWLSISLDAILCHARSDTLGAIGLLFPNDCLRILFMITPCRGPIYRVL